MKHVPLRLKTGDLIEVRSREEILATLDEKGCLDGMPFMPEMLQYCGRRMHVGAVAHKACDSKCKSGLRSVPDCVHLEDVRCNGTGHDGCQARCYVFWKTAWLRKPAAGTQMAPTALLNEADLWRLAYKDEADGRHYTCQATELLEASRPLPWWKPGPYIRDVTSGNISFKRAARVLFLSWFEAWRRYGFPYRVSRWVYDRVHSTILPERELPFPPHGFPYPAKTPTGHFDLKVGELVRVKPHLTIRATLNNNRNRGLWFDPEMTPYCGREFRVSQRVDKIIDELTGKMISMKNPCIMLDGVWCRSEYTQNRRFCPKAMIIYWREIWLERVEEHEDAPVPSERESAPNH